MLKTKKLLISFPVIILFVFLCTAFAYADGSKVGTVTGNYVNVRQSPDISANVLTQLFKGDTVNVVNSSGDWYQISNDSVNGWICADYVSVGGQAGVVTGNAVNVRSGPDLSSSVITRMDKGNEVNVYESSGEWYKVGLSDGSYGWIYKTYVATRSSNASRGSSDGMVRGTGSGEGQQIVDYAKELLGVRYVYGGSSPSGFDCSGFTKYVYAHFGIDLERVAADQAQNGSWVSKSGLQAGDLVFFDTDGGNDYINHAGIYIGDGQFIQASSGSSAHKVVISDLNSGFYANAYMTARRYIQ